MALGELVDGFGRRLNYVRISVTDRCNFRCTYCMPEEGVKCLSHRDILRYEDIAFLCGAFAELGVGKFRFTGGDRAQRACAVFAEPSRRNAAYKNCPHDQRFAA